MRIERVEEPTVFGFTWGIYGLPDDDPRHTYVEFTLEPTADGHPADGRRVRLRAAAGRRATGRHSRPTPTAGPTSWASWSSTSMPTQPDIEAVAEEVFTALADPSRREILAALAAGGPATATDLATRLPITRQAIAKHLALLAEAGLVAAEPGERRRVRYRLRSAPMQVAQQFLAALARDWDRQLGALQDHIDAVASAEPTRKQRKTS